MLGDTLKKLPLTLPDVLKGLSNITFEEVKKMEADPEVEKRFPHTSSASLVKATVDFKTTHRPLKIGVVLSGGQAAGGHNVIIGLFDALKGLNSASILIGFLGGPGGIVDNKFRELQSAELDEFRNSGGFDLIGSGRTKIETDEQLEKALKAASDLDGLVIIGGDDSNTNAAVLAEYFKDKKCPCQVIGVPKTIDGDLQNDYVPISFGFDTATKVYSEMIGNICRDAKSAKKYTHFIKLMGRSASHIALECALKTHPNYTLISEEKKSLKEITDEIASLIDERAEKGKNYSVILIPEGIIEFAPDLLETLPEDFSVTRDDHGNIEVSKIETEKLIMDLVKAKLKSKMSAQAHFLGYEGRAGFPSLFDATYCNALGHAAAALLSTGFTGYMACISGLTAPTKAWDVYGLPLTSLMTMEERKGELKPVISKALVDLKGPAYQRFVKERAKWAFDDDYQYPGPIQYFGDESITQSYPSIIIK